MTFDPADYEYDFDFDDLGPEKSEPDCGACNDSGTTVLRGAGGAKSLIEVETVCYCAGGLDSEPLHQNAGVSAGPFIDEPPF